MVAGLNFDFWLIKSITTGPISTWEVIWIIHTRAPTKGKKNPNLNDSLCKMISPFSEWETSGILKDYECQNAARSHSELEPNKSSFVIASIRAIFVRLPFRIVLNLIHKCGFLGPGHYVINAQACSPHHDSCPHFCAIFLVLSPRRAQIAPPVSPQVTVGMVLDCSLCANWLCQPARWRAGITTAETPFFDTCPLGTRQCVSSQIWALTPCKARSQCSSILVASG